MTSAGPSAGRSTTPIWRAPWRKGLPARPDEDPVAEGTGSPLALGAVLDALLDSKGSWQAGLAGGELGRRWQDVVGERLAGDTAPGGLDDRGMLVVRASSPAWAAQLRFLSGRIAENANEVLGRDAVREVRVGVAPGLADAVREPPDTPRRRGPPAPEDRAGPGPQNGPNGGRQTGGSAH
jgi:predicted nucleic acid-binding Zn ribbon protein